jgi:hypothetical protein
VGTLRVLALTVVLLGMAATGALAGLFARQLETVGTQTEDGGQQPAQQTRSRRVDPAPRQITIVVHRGSGADAAQAPAGGLDAPAQVPAPQPAPQPAPTVQAPAAPVESAGTSSGSSPG